MAAVGSAVGLGNIWGFPFKMGKGGGFAFLLIYLVLAAVCGAVVMLGELALGRKTGQNAVTAYRAVSSRFGWVGALAPVTAMLILSFYSALGGYCIRYLVLNVGCLFGTEWGANGLSGATVFAEATADGGMAVVYGMIFMALTAVIVALGVRGGIERFCSVGMPLLMAMLAVIILRACTLPGAAAGLRFMFVPDFTPLREDFMGVLRTAGGQMFFSLSLAAGVMITYGSYTEKKQHLARSAVTIVLCDTAVGLLAGMAVLPAAFALGAPESAMQGPALLFITLQDVFSGMGQMGFVFGIIFYGLVILAALASSVSMLEVPVAYWTDRQRQKGDKKRRRWPAVLCLTVLSGALCAITCADGLGGNGVWVPFQRFFAGAEKIPAFCDCWLDFLDMLSEGLLMPLGALLTCVMIGWVIKPETIRAEVEQEDNRFKTYRFYRICVRYIAPAVIALILWGQIRAFFG
ncbi:MAG: sodium-dependent transporter [Oscillospiraceae bacterium]|nr:sodium-dependent transporter [Oscillospiraceae bacterium]